MTQIESGRISKAKRELDDGARIRETLATLEAAYRNETWHWMPDVARPIDVIAGAILVQHTTWTSAERALESLRAAGALDPQVLASMPEDEIAALVRVSGTPSVKARRLRAMAQTMATAGGIEAFLVLPLDEMRPLLLATRGVGPETADAIALYAAGKRTFVIDAYTQRIFSRLGLEPNGGAGYDAWQRRFERALAGEDAEAFQRYHGYIVLHAKALCRVAPKCARVPAPAFVPVWAGAHGVTAATLALLAIIAAGCANPFGANATPTATFTRTATHTATSTPTPTATATPTATPTPSLPANPDALQRWNKLPVTYCVVTGDGYVSAEEFAAAIERSFATWGVQAVNSGVCEGIVDDDDVNEIGWGDLSAATNRGADTYEAGLTSLRYRECTAGCDPDDPVHIVEADITIDTSPPGEFQNERCLYSTMLHETGHFLGLEHLPAPAVMAPETTTCPDELTDADRGSLLSRYGAAAQPQ